jgi:diguanylate cyclase (GGDEF)-like protein
MDAFAENTARFVAELDAATEAHMDWTRRVLRCAVLRSPPGDDVLADDAHCRCRFGRWFGQQRDAFERVDADATARLFVAHERMHGAVRTLCSALLAGAPGRAADLDVFEVAQAALVADLGLLKTQILENCARSDPLTGLPLRHRLESEFERCRAQARRNAQVLVVMLADVDHFKQINDLHGHAVGDEALRHLAGVLRAATRGGEPLFRYGGEEFLILLQTADTEAAEQAAERLLQALRDAPMALPGGATLSLRLSAGLALVGPGEALASVVERADRAMYEVKRNGRDGWRWDRDDRH